MKIVHRLFKNSIPAGIFILFTSCFSSSLWAQDQIKWVDWNQVQALMRKEKRKVLVDIYTDWCGWCKRMEASTFQDPRVVHYINKKYYAVRFNAEYKEDIQFKSRVYKFMENGKRGIHQLAIEITNGRLKYPTFVFMDEDFNTIQPFPGYQDAETFEILANFFGGNHYKTTPYESFVEKFKPEPLPKKP
ncbi:MAG: DUF255 domain-containing protein [Saprospiraceae bacterium]|nr:DUF255 domain-containing protein [Saprospiraceae bacterium]